MLKNTEIKSILVIGVEGGLAKMTCRKLVKKYPHAKIVGVDSRKVKKIKALNNITYQTIRYRRGDFEKLFRKHQFDVVYNLGRLSHAQLNTPMNIAERMDFGLVGTKKIFDLCLDNGVKKIIFLSTFHVYGASSDNPVYMNEESPLRASIEFADLRDVVEIDFVAANWMWKNQNKIEAIVFRPCNVIGPTTKNVMTQYLSHPLAPYPIDFNPAFQFIHNQDMATVLADSLVKVPTGVYNVAPDETILIRDALRACGNKGFPMPLSILSPMARFLKKFGSPFPEYLFEYLKYPCLIDSSALKKYLGDDFIQYSLKGSLKTLYSSKK
jgi:UDP-glucose 4-epimerase